MSYPLPLFHALPPLQWSSAEVPLFDGAGLSQQHRLDPPMGCVTDVQARHLIGRMLQRKPGYELYALAIFDAMLGAS